MLNLRFIMLITMILGLASAGAIAGELRLPPNPVAGQPLTIGTGGDGEATVILVGPSQVLKRQVRLGNDLEIKGEELRGSGRWIAILR